MVSVYLHDGGCACGRGGKWCAYLGNWAALANRSVTHDNINRVAVLFEDIVALLRVGDVEPRSLELDPQLLGLYRSGWLRLRVGGVGTSKPSMGIPWSWTLPSPNPTRISYLLGLLDIYVSLPCPTLDFRSETCVWI